MPTTSNKLWSALINHPLIAQSLPEGPKRDIARDFVIAFHVANVIDFEAMAEPFAIIDGIGLAARFMFANYHDRVQPMWERASDGTPDIQPALDQFRKVLLPDYSRSFKALRDGGDSSLLMRGMENIHRMDRLIHQAVGAKLFVEYRTGRMTLGELLLHALRETAGK